MAAMERMTVEEREAAFQSVADHLAKVVKLELESCVKSCISCGHFVEKTEQCQMFNQRPPARIIASGCENYDYIPF